VFSGKASSLDVGIGEVTEPLKKVAVIFE